MIAILGVIRGAEGLGRTHLNFLPVKPEEDNLRPNQHAVAYPIIPSFSFFSVCEQQFQIQNVVKDTKGSMYLLARVLL
jgi:hypothetical protein